MQERRQKEKEKQTEEKKRKILFLAVEQVEKGEHILDSSCSGSRCIFL